MSIKIKCDFRKDQILRNRFVLRQAKCRRAMEQPPYIIELKWEDVSDSVSLEVMGTAEEILDSIDLCAKAIMVWLEENDISEFKTKEAVEEMEKSNYSRATVMRALPILLEQSKILRKKRGIYKKVLEKETLEGFNEVSKSQ